MTFDPFGLVGQILDGQYRVDRVVGEGGFGVVYQGYHLSFEQPIAIKALKVPELDVAMQNSVLAKFKDEARLLYVLSQASLNVVRSIAFGAVTTPRGPWAPFVVLEWLEGKSLAEDLDERRKAKLSGRPLEEMIHLLDPAARGLIAAHHQKIAHRDVKPGNFFLTKTGDIPPMPTMKVLDFGIAKVMNEGDATRATGFVSFTPYYAAPEQLDTRLGQTGLHTDVYSFALVCVEVLTGRPPVDGTELIHLLAEATDPARRPTPRARGANVTDAVEAVFARALSVDPRARQAHIEQMWDALTKAAAEASRLGTAAIPSAQGRHPRVPTALMPASRGPGLRSVPPTAPMEAVTAPMPPALPQPAHPLPTPPPQPAPFSASPYGPPAGPAPWQPPVTGQTPIAAPYTQPAPTGGSSMVLVIVITAGVSLFFLLFLLMLLLR